MKKFFIISILLIPAAVVFWGVVYAQLADVSYPVKELGGCKDQADCKIYCDNQKNADACLAFAKQNGIMTDKEIKVAEKFLSGDLNGPGGCTDKDSCDAYCSDMAHIDECIKFAEDNNFLPPQELEEAKKVQAAIARGVKPPSCGNKKACDAYCEDPNHMEECVNFALEAGFMQGKEAEDAQKMLEAVKRGVKPPPCKGRDACDEYCSNPDNMEVCMNFAMEAGMMSEEEKENSQKMLQALKQGIKPPPCKGKEECDAYCGSEEHFEECTNFAVAAGFMSEEDAAMARKTGGKGPGGCKSKEECDAYCNANQETCMQFAIDNGMMSEEDLKRMQEGKQQTMDALSNASPETLDCLNLSLGSDFVEKMKAGTAMMSQEIGDKMSTCFMQNSEGMMGGAPAVPCKSPEECTAFCESNPDQCENGVPKFQPGPGEINPGGNMMPPQAGPGGCETPEECQAYCQEHQEECKNFYPAGDESQAGPMMSPEGQIPPGDIMPPCEGENCQGGPLPGQEILPGQPPMPGQPMLPGQDIQQPSGQPGSGGELIPGQEPVPLAPPTNQTPPADQESQPPSSSISADSLIGSLLYAVIKLLVTGR